MTFYALNNDNFSGANRIKTVGDLRSHFGVESQRVLRFSIEQLEEMIDVMKVRDLIEGKLFIILLQIPKEFVFCGHRSTGVEALAISLHRMSSHVR